MKIYAVILLYITKKLSITQILNTSKKGSADLTKLFFRKIITKRAMEF